MSHVSKLPSSLSPSAYPPPLPLPVFADVSSPDTSSSTPGPLEAKVGLPPALPLPDSSSIPGPAVWRVVGFVGVSLPEPDPATEPEPLSGPEPDPEPEPVSSVALVVVFLSAR